ncbi:MAG: hypothetical protein F6K54_18120 [Okeania sp. SIO3B5]|uniref:hypothetical protein n=1 Tax=Okeania sp. SIO3B5 TaxID=2607811 RepID=UPI0013FF96D6|nr:hypothetical protein [Okeania sp. SIO3B5]NEO54828.1 hypothetical protein [Okeania sp. SIO3B5]
MVQLTIILNFYQSKVYTSYVMLNKRQRVEIAQSFINKNFGVAELKYECAIVWFWLSPRASPVQQKAQQHLASPDPAGDGRGIKGDF